MIDLARLLIIEDHADTRALYAAVLRTAGHEALVAASGEEGLTIHARHHPQLVVVDLFMPGQSGLETIVELRRQSRAVKFIAVSAGWAVSDAGDYGILHAAKAAGADLALGKPLPPPVLIEAVGELLQQRRAG